jgi:hypothetical protein
MITSDGLEKLGFTPNVDFVLQDDGDGVYIKEWNSASPQPTEAEIETAHAEWQAEYDSKAYARARAEAYPSIGDQLDMQYHDQTEGSRTWLDAIEAVKEAYPK